MSRDVVIPDATRSRAIGLDPGKLLYLSEARHLPGNIDIDRISSAANP